MKGSVFLSSEYFFNAKCRQFNGGGKNYRTNKLNWNSMYRERYCLSRIKGNTFRGIVLVNTNLNTYKAFICRRIVKG